MSDTLKIECPLCGEHSSVPASFAGKLCKCSGCMETIRVPELAPEPAPIVAAEPGEPPPPAEKTCPHCGESIRQRARKCRYCGEFLDPKLRQEQRTLKKSPVVKWAFPTVAMVLLPVQVTIVVLAALACALVRTDAPSFAVWGSSALFSLVWVVVAILPQSEGNRLRLLTLVLAAGLQFVASLAVVASLGLPGEPPSPLLGAVHGTLGLILGAVYYRALKARRIAPS